MRTKNFNLKKKIAFIASVTMIATTAAYLPAEVAQNIGIGSGIVASAAGATSLDLFDIYVKVNGRYLATNDKSYTSMAALKADGAIAKTIIATDGTMSGDALTFATSNVIALPVDTPANATITVEAVTRENNTAAFVSSAKSSYEVVLNDEGKATFKKSAKIEVVDGNKATANTDGTYSKGTGASEDDSIETVDFKNLSFAVAKYTVTSDATDHFAALKYTVANGSQTTAAIASTGDSAPKVEKVTLSNGSEVYATVLTVASVAGVTPGANLKVEFTKQGTWTPSAEPTVAFDSEGKATTGAITFTNATGEKAYYVFNFEKATVAAVNDKANIQLNVAAGAKTIDMGNNATATPADSAYKVVTSTDVVNGEYVTVFHVYTNNTTDKTFYVKNDTSNTGKKIYQKTSGEYVEADGAAATDTDDNVLKFGTNDTKVESPVMYYGAATGTGDGGKVVNADVAGGAFKIIVDTEYTIPVEYDEENNETPYDAEKYADGEVSVKGKTISAKPASPTKAGWTFDGWYTSNDGATKTNATTGKVYSAAGTTQQNKDSMNPNVILLADWKANKYTVRLDGNKGSFVSATVTAANAYTTGKTYDIVTENTEDETGTTASVIEVETAADTEETVFNGKTLNAALATPSRKGYTFKGWALTANAAVADVLDVEAYEAERPTESGSTITLYAVWEAKENSVTFKELAGTDLTAWKTYGANVTGKADIKSSTATAATVNVAGVKVKTDGTIDSLPTATKKGYSFAGWYRAAVDKTDDTKVSGVQVTSASPIAFDDLDYDATAANQTTLTLFAKFNVEKYTITYDLNDGEWTEQQTKDASKTYTIKSGSLTIPTPTKGTGAYYEFTGWTINNVTSKKYMTATEVLGALKDLTGNVTLKATYDKKSNVDSKGFINLDLNGGRYYNVTSDGKYYDYDTSEVTNVWLGRWKDAATGTELTGTELSSVNRTTGDSGTYTKTDSTTGQCVKLYESGVNYDAKARVQINGDKNTAIAEEFDGNKITEDSSNTLRDFIVAKAGYTFTGWYEDKECTTPYTFDQYPDGTEVTVYAGWTPLATTRYILNYNLVDKDGSLINISTDASGKPVIDGSKTCMGETGSTVSASDKEITFGGKTYVFDSALSAGQTTSAELKAVYEAVDGADNAVKTLVIDSDEYTEIWGVYKEKGTETKELGTATNVAVKDGTVTWTAADNADHYRIQKTVNGKTYYGAKVTDAKATYTVPVEEHEIAVVAYNADESEKTVSTVVKVAASTKLGKATNVKCAEDGTVTFSAATGATQYQVAKIVNGNTYYSAKSDATSIKISPATEDYEVYVIAFDSTGKLSTHSETIKVPAAASTLEAVDDSTITVDGDGKVTWTAAKGAVAYKVFKITKNSEGKEVTNWGSKVTTTSYTFKNLPKTDYKVYVAAIDANGNVKYSAKKKISSLPAATNVKLSSDKMTVSWTAPTGTNADKIVKYQVAKFDTAANKTNYSVKVDAPATSITMRNAAVAGTKIFVLAFDADGNSSYSASIDVK